MTLYMSSVNMLIYYCKIIIIIIYISYIYGEVTITASNPSLKASFGASTAVYDDYILIGAPKKGKEHGSAYSFRKVNNNWTEEYIIIGSDTVDNDRFGVSVALSADLAIIGAEGHNNLTGAVYIYTKSFQNNSHIWINEYKLTESNNIPYAAFGSSLSLAGDYLLVGGRGVHAFFYKRLSYNVWSSGYRVNAPTYNINILYRDWFGASVSLLIDNNSNKNYAIIGAPAANFSTGYAHIFESNKTNNIWIHIAKLSLPGGVRDNFFGAAVGLSKQYAVVGATGIFVQTGAAYVFKRQSMSNIWNLVQTLNPIARFASYFGSPLVVLNDFLVIGMSETQGYGDTFLYRLTPDGIWTREIIFTTPNQYSVGDMFGSSVALFSNKTILVGAQDSKYGFGSVFVYTNCGYGHYMKDQFCLPCNLAFYENRNFSIGCRLCPQGMHYPFSCSHGTYSEGTGRSLDCPLCPAGFYCSTTIHKLPCPPGYYCKEGSTNITLCPAAFYCPEAIAKPVACPIDHFCGPGSGDPLPCRKECPSNAPYLLSSCTSINDIVCTEINVNKTHTFAVPYILISLAIGFGLLVLLLSKIIGHKYPSSKPIRLFMFIFAGVDMISDIAYILYIREIYQLAFIISIGIFVTSMLSQGSYLTWIIFSRWINEDEFQHYISEHLFFLSLVYFVASTNIESIMLISSKVFNLNMLSAPLYRDDELLISRAGSITVVFETIPQLIVQLIVALDQKELTGIIGFALLISTIQLLIAILKYGLTCVLLCKQKDRQNFVEIEEDKSTLKRRYYKLEEELVAIRDKLKDQGYELSHNNK